MRLAKVVWFGLAAVSLGVLANEPSLAGNKFEIIGSGVSGMHALKRDHLRLTLFAVSGILLFSALLAVFVPHKNALFMNSVNWRQSALFLGIVGGLVFCGALLL